MRSKEIVLRQQKGKVRSENQLLIECDVPLKKILTRNENNKTSVD